MRSRNRPGMASSICSFVPERCTSVVADTPESGGDGPPRHLGESVLDRVVDHRVEQLGPVAGVSPS